MPTAAFSKVRWNRPSSRVLSRASASMRRAWAAAKNKVPPSVSTVRTAIARPGANRPARSPSAATSPATRGTPSSAGSARRSCSAPSERPASTRANRYPGRDASTARLSSTTPRAPPGLAVNPPKRRSSSTEYRWPRTTSVARASDAEAASSPARAARAAGLAARRIAAPTSRRPRAVGSAIGASRAGAARASARVATPSAAQAAAAACASLRVQRSPGSRARPTTARPASTRASEGTVWMGPSESRSDPGASALSSSSAAPRPTEARPRCDDSRANRGCAALSDAIHLLELQSAAAARIVPGLGETVAAGALKVNHRFEACQCDASHWMGRSPAISHSKRTLCRTRSPSAARARAAATESVRAPLRAARRRTDERVDTGPRAAGKKVGVDEKGHAVAAGDPPAGRLRGLTGAPDEVRGKAAVPQSCGVRAPCGDESHVARMLRVRRFSSSLDRVSSAGSLSPHAGDGSSRKL